MLGVEIKFPTVSAEKFLVVKKQVIDRPIF